MNQIIEKRPRHWAAEILEAPDRTTQAAIYRQVPDALQALVAEHVWAEKSKRTANIYVQSVLGASPSGTDDGRRLRAECINPAMLKHARLRLNFRGIKGDVDPVFLKTALCTLGGEKYAVEVEGLDLGRLAKVLKQLKSMNVKVTNNV